MWSRQCWIWTARLGEGRGRGVATHLGSQNRFGFLTLLREVGNEGMSWKGVPFKESSRRVYKGHSISHSLLIAPASKMDGFPLEPPE